MHLEKITLASMLGTNWRLAKVGWGHGAGPGDGSMDREGVGGEWTVLVRFRVLGDGLFGWA